jgi:hypothetical protein
MARTRITNNSGQRRYFGWIPPHGIDLDDGADVVLDGDIRSVLASGRGRFSRGAELNGLDADIQAGVVAVAEEAELSSSSSSP